MDTAKVNEESLSTWVVSGVGAVVGSTVSALVYLWKLGESKNAKEIQELKENHQNCEKRFEESNAEILNLSVKLASVEARMQTIDGKRNA